MTHNTPGHILSERVKHGIRWQARISDDRGRLEVVAVIPPSTRTTIVEPLSEGELCELLGEVGAAQ